MDVLTVCLFNRLFVFTLLSKLTYLGSGRMVLFLLFALLGLKKYVIYGDVLGWFRYLGFAIISLIFRSVNILETSAGFSTIAVSAPEPVPAMAITS